MVSEEQEEAEVQEEEIEAERLRAKEDLTLPENLLRNLKRKWQQQMFTTICRRKRASKRHRSLRKF